MAINLFQGADPSLVTSAARAGLASAPPDYSKTFESPMTATGSYEGFVPHGGPTSMYE